MRLTTLLDTISTPGATGSWAPNQPLAVPAVVADGDEFDQLISTLLPCRSNDPELWFAEQAARIEAAKALCRTCPVRAGCLAGAIERAEPWGVWGGEVFVDGVVVARKRGRGRPSKAEILARQAADAAAAAAASADPAAAVVDSERVAA